MANHEMSFGFTNESKNIYSYGGIAFLKRSQTSRTPCMICAGGTPIRTLLVKHLPPNMYVVPTLLLKYKSSLSHDIRFLLNLETNKRIQPYYQRNTNLFTFRWGE